MNHEILYTSYKGNRKKPSIRTNEDSMIVDQERGIYIISDGVGGKPAAKDASLMSVTSAYSRMINLYNNLREGNYSESDMAFYIENAIQYSNEVINTLSNGLSELKNMAATLDIGFIFDNKLYYGHVGDGGIWIMNSKKEGLEKIVFQTPEDVIQFDSDDNLKKNEKRIELFDRKLNKYIGQDTIIDVCTGYEDFYSKSNDIFIMGSDGFFKSFTEEQLVDLISNEISVVKKKTHNVQQKFRLFEMLKKEYVAPKEIVEQYAKFKEIPYDEANDIFKKRDDCSYIIGWIN